MNRHTIGFALLLPLMLCTASSVAQGGASAPSPEEAARGSTDDNRFQSYLGAITRSTAEGAYETGAATALLLEGPSPKGRFRGEWRQLGELNITLQGKRMANGNLRLTGMEFVAVCREDAAVAGLDCLLQTPDGAAVAQLAEGENGDDDSDCVSCVDERKAGCCQGNSECCTYCAPADECGVASDSESIP